MLEQLNRYFVAVHRLRRSERKLVRSGAVSDLKDLQNEVGQPRLRRLITAALNEHVQREARAS